MNMKEQEINWYRDNIVKYYVDDVMRKLARNEEERRRLYLKKGQVNDNQ